MQDRKEKELIQNNTLEIMCPYCGQVIWVYIGKEKSILEEKNVWRTIMDHMCDDILTEEN